MRQTNEDEEKDYLERELSLLVEKTLNMEHELETVINGQQ